jgi:hypothetical protein
VTAYIFARNRKMEGVTLPGIEGRSREAPRNGKVEGVRLPKWKERWKE